jgi:hypothetical protein
MVIESLVTLIPSALGMISSLVKSAVDWRSSKRNLEFQRWRAEQEQKLQLQVASQEAQTSHMSEKEKLVLERRHFEQDTQLKRSLLAAQYEWQRELARFQRETHFEIAAYQKDADFQIAAYNREVELKLETRRQFFQTWRLEQEQKIQKELAVFNRETRIQADEKRIDFEKWRFQEEKKLELELSAYAYEKRLEIAAYQRQTAIQSIEYKKILDNYPLKLSPTQILDSYKEYQDSKEPMPLLIFISPPQLDFDQFGNDVREFPRIEKELAEGMRQFLDNYSNQNRPIRFLPGAWETKRIHSETAVEMLFWTFRSIPTLILESEVDDEHLNLRAAFWGIGQQTPRYKPIISRLPYRNILFKSAKANALKWRIDRDKYIAQGKTEAELAERGGIDETNLRTLELEEADKSLGINRGYEYKVDSTHFENLSDFLTLYHCLIAGWVADVYHLTNTKAAPLLPSLLPSLSRDVLTPDIIESIGINYEAIYEMLGTDMSHWMPELYLDLARAMAELPNKTWAMQQVDKAIQYWIELHPKAARPGGNGFEIMKSGLEIEDMEFVGKLKDCFLAIEEVDRSTQMEGVLNSWHEKRINGEIKRDSKGDTLHDSWG